ncbi:hypothetical protein [Alcaligenes faecalis]|uniref:hypothetical protein n=1 Tax=Alcaligenes faecalis TaxID=511 RepID=UPI001C9AA97F|nr:hypothetical protein [Alcaligenes faecalis]MBY6310429.1 hypothetical protein [Alcaligenes faecalis]MBY6315914.1 hypothetical protein [Alcaligenes faecalis]MBY6390879.1 hypothetical protein [Alcaligenes faecalis]
MLSQGGILYPIHVSSKYNFVGFTSATPERQYGSRNHSLNLLTGWAEKLEMHTISVRPNPVLHIHLNPLIIKENSILLKNLKVFRLNFNFGLPAQQLAEMLVSDINRIDAPLFSIDKTRPA